jgi:hypothetical protein
VEDNLNSLAFSFLKDCLAELESRGLTDQVPIQQKLQVFVYKYL